MPRFSRPAPGQLPIVKAIPRIRWAMGWTAERMAQEMGLTVHVWKRYESGCLVMSLTMVERMRNATGIDPYMLTYCLHHDTSKLPPRVRELTAMLGQELEQMIELCHRVRHKAPNW